MYSLQEYNKHETSFLSHIAEKWGFTERCKFIFEQRFLSGNDDLKTNELVEVLEKNLEEYNPDKKNINYNDIFRDELKKIYRKLEEQGCNFHGQTHNKFPIAKDWLQKICWPKYQQDFLWHLMKNQGSLTDNMKLILVPPAKPASLDMWETEEPEHNYVTSVSLGSQIHFEINLDSPGHLLLLQKGTSGKFWCMCPSFLVADTHLPAGKTILPQEEKLKNEYLKISGKTGQDEMLAVISPELPNFNWLPKVKNGIPLEMKPNHFSELAAYLETTKPTVFYMEYTITA